MTDLQLPGQIRLTVPVEKQAQDSTEEAGYRRHQPDSQQAIGGSQQEQQRGRQNQRAHEGQQQGTPRHVQGREI